MQLPVIHANGSDPDALRDSYLRAVNAADILIDALRDCAPNGRDYYPASPEAIVAAAAEHHARVTAVRNVQYELQVLGLHVIAATK